MDHLQQVFHNLHDEKLSRKLIKCHFPETEIQYLGHVLSTAGIKLLPSKTATIKLMNPPRNAQNFLQPLLIMI